MGKEGYELLAQDGKPKLITVLVPGEIVLKTANRYFSISDFLASGEIPNIVRDILEAWSYYLANPDFNSKSLKID